MLKLEFPWFSYCWSHILTSSSWGRSCCWSWAGKPVCECTLPWRGPPGTGGLQYQIFACWRIIGTTFFPLPEGYFSWYFGDGYFWCSHKEWCCWAWWTVYGCLLINLTQHPKTQQFLNLQLWLYLVLLFWIYGRFLFSWFHFLSWTTYWPLYIYVFFLFFF